MFNSTQIHPKKQILPQKQDHLNVCNYQPNCINCTYFPTNSNLHELIIAQHDVINKMKLDLNQLKTEYNILLNKIEQFESFNINNCQIPPFYWTMYEHNKFLHAIKLFGVKDVQSISWFIGTRTPSHVRIHSQKYLQNLKKQKIKRNNSSIKKNTNNQHIESCVNTNLSNYETTCISNEPITNSFNIENLFN